ncbi:hypothetical protein PG993_011996 [Apiospora rasikravindrae]|uniref:Uncharacterized protein n=1 Tax=Apiospora rasikravindrae TaxID=990691 RepID=A0ABR1S2P6_9PEZI
MRPGITPVNSGFSDTSATTLIGDDDETGVQNNENGIQSKATDTLSKHNNFEKKSTRDASPHLRLRRQIFSGLHFSFCPVDLYKMGCHLWHVVQDYWWLWELATIFMSFVSMAVAIVALAVEDGKSLDDWDFTIQPNSLISVFITLSKSATMTVLTGAITQSMWMQFEQRSTPLMRVEEIQEAGRGPWGSIKLLMAMMKGKRFNLVAIAGAVITVATLALDPFAQQVMFFPSRTIPAKDGKAIFKSTQTWRDLDMTSVQGAVFGGIYRNPQITNYKCTEASCSWPTITTLGVCSICQDLTLKAEVKCSTTPGPKIPSQSDTMSFLEANGQDAEHSSQWTKIKLLPQEGYDNYSAKNVLGGMISPDVDYWFTTVLSYSTFFDSRTHPLPKVTPALLMPQILGCGLHPCGQVWTTPSVVNGTMADGGAPTSSVPLRHLYSNVGLDRFYPTPNRSDYSDVLQVVNKQRSVLFPGNGTFTVSQTVANNLTNLMTQMYRATSLGGNENFGDAFPEKVKGIYGLTDALFDANIDSRDETLATAAAADSSGSAGAMTAVKSPIASFARVARGLSEYVRNNDNLDSSSGDDAESQEDWNGKAWRQETYIEVRWVFLTLPLVVLAATLALLCVAVLRSRGQGARVWKSSSLALLFHDVYGEMAVTASDDAKNKTDKPKGEKSEKMARQWHFQADSVKSMNEEAEKVEARLAAHDDRFLFVVGQEGQAI